MREIKGYDGKYLVDESGSVYSTKYNNTDEIQVLKPRVNDRGRLYVNLCRDGKSKSCKIHRIVAETYLEGYEEGLEVNHKDGNKLNNHFSNLEWASRVENLEHGVENGLFQRGEDRPTSKFKESDVKEMRRLFDNGVSVANLANSYKCSKNTMYRILKRELWKHI